MFNFNFFFSLGSKLLDVILLTRWFFHSNVWGNMGRKGGRYSQWRNKKSNINGFEQQHWIKKAVYCVINKFYATFSDCLSYSNLYTHPTFSIENLNHCQKCYKLSIWNCKHRIFFIMSPAVCIKWAFCSTTIIRDMIVRIFYVFSFRILPRALAFVFVSVFSAHTHTHTHILSIWSVWKKQQIRLLAGWLVMWVVGMVEEYCGNVWRWRKNKNSNKKIRYNSWKNTKESRSFRTIWWLF